MYHFITNDFKTHQPINHTTYSGRTWMLHMKQQMCRLFIEASTYFESAYIVKATLDL